MALPRTLNETWLAVAAADVQVVTFVRTGPSTFECRADHFVRRQSDSAIVKRPSKVITLSAANQTTFGSFVTATIVPDINNDPSA